MVSASLESMPRSGGHFPGSRFPKCVLVELYYHHPCYLLTFKRLLFGDQARASGIGDLERVLIP